MAIYAVYFSHTLPINIFQESIPPSLIYFLLCVLLICVIFFRFFTVFLLYLFSLIFGIQNFLRLNYTQICSPFLVAKYFQRRSLELTGFLSLSCRARLSSKHSPSCGSYCDQKTSFLFVQELYIPPSCLWSRLYSQGKSYIIITVTLGLRSDFVFIYLYFTILS